MAIKHNFIIETKKIKLRSQRIVERLGGKRHRRIIFLHIPKCSGSSINLHFKGNIGSGRSARVVLFNSMDGSAYNPAEIERARRAEYVGGHFGWDTLTEIAEGAFCFTVLREPVARLRSLYLFCRKLKPEKNAGKFPLDAARRLSFEQFCLCEAPHVRAFVDNAQARTLAGDYPLDRFPLESVEETAKRAIENLRRLDFVTVTERLDNVLPELTLASGTRLVSSTIRRNVGQDGPSPSETAKAEFKNLTDSLRERCIADHWVYEEAMRLDTARSFG